MKRSSTRLFEVTSSLCFAVTPEVMLSNGEDSVGGIGPWDATPSRGNPT